MITRFSIKSMRAVFYLAPFLLILFSCSGSRHVSSSQYKTNDKELKTFLASGVEKKLKTGNTTPNDIIKTAKTYMGTPHCMGGYTKKCTDCSGLIMTVFEKHGIEISHNSQEQARYGKIIQHKSGLQKGDLVFFINTYKTTKYITHVGIYLGNNEFIHTSSSKGVTITSLDNSWWKDKFIFGTRIF